MRLRSLLFEGRNQMKILLERWIAYSERRCLYWWQPGDGRVNAGDHLSRTIVEAMLGLRDLELRHKREPKHRLFAIGSVLHQARDGETVWGSGINGKIPEQRHRFSQLDVRAVRGPLTRDYLQARGIEVPDIYGDPALLMPLFYPEPLLEVEPTRDFVVVPHFNEPVGKYARYVDRLVLPDQKPMAFLRQLLSARRVVSSSLHGVILAEAYGRAATYLDSGNGESRFKYDDYYQGTGREAWRCADTVEACLQLDSGGLVLAPLQDRLMAAFPFDLW
jgi:pyruvyltransferase